MSVAISQISGAGHHLDSQAGTHDEDEHEGETKPRVEDIADVSNGEQDAHRGEVREECENKKSTQNESDRKSDSTGEQFTKLRLNYEDSVGEGYPPTSSSEQEAEKGVREVDHEVRSAIDSDEDSRPTKTQKSKEELEKEELTKEIFGDSDEDAEFEIPEPAEYKESDEDDEDYEELNTRKLKRLVKQRHKEKRRKRNEESDEEQKEAHEYGSDHQGASQKKKRKGIKQGSGELPNGETKRKRAKKKKAQDADEANAAFLVSPGNDSDSGVQHHSSASRRRTNASLETSDIPEFDMALERIKKKRPKKPADEELTSTIRGFIYRMEQAAEADIQANKEKNPATHKTKMLPEVVATLNKAHVTEKFVAQDGLTCLKKWLDPLPDGSLPNLNVREHILAILFKLPVHTDHLRESGIGKVVMFLWKSNHETPQNKKLCNQIIEKWSRPIFGLSSKYEELEAIESELPTTRKAPKRANDDVESALDKRTKEQMKDVRRLHAAIPEKVAMDFRKRPTVNDLKVDLPVIRSPHVAAAEADKIIKKKLKGKVPPTRMGSRVLRAERISIEGRMV
jgi:hypothetical protein